MKYARVMLRPTGTAPDKVRTIVPGEHVITHRAQYEADEIDKRTLRGDRRTRFQQAKLFPVLQFTEDES